jgi:hypothetical protein
MREIQISSSVEGKATHCGELRVRVDGETVGHVRGFSLAGHINAPHVHGPAATLTVHHWTWGETPPDYVSGVYRVAVEVPVWVEFVRTPHPGEPVAEQPDSETHFLLREILRALENKTQQSTTGEETYAAFHRVAQEKAENHPGMKAFVDTLPPPEE